MLFPPPTPCLGLPHMSTHHAPSWPRAESRETHRKALTSLIFSTLINRAVSIFTAIASGSGITYLAVMHFSPNGPIGNILGNLPIYTTPPIGQSANREIELIKKSNFNARTRMGDRTITCGPYLIVGPWFDGYQCGMRIPRPGFISQRVCQITDADIGQVG